MSPSSSGNRLYYGDNLDVLRKKIQNESVDLCYIDPPFNSKRNYNQIYNNIGAEDRAQAQAFTDTWIWDDYANKGFEEILDNAHGRFSPQLVALIKGLLPVLGKGSLLAYIISMSLRVTEIHRVLRKSGSFYMHCDPTASHYLKLVLDAVFCPVGGDYRNEIVWKRTSSHNDSRKFAQINDCILYYSKTKDCTWNPQFTPPSDRYLRTHYNQTDKTGRVYRLHCITRSASMGPRPNLAYEYDGYTPEWGWRMVREKLEALDRDGRLLWVKGRKGDRMPYLVRYLDEQEGSSMSSLWDDIPPVNSQAQERLGYPTQKPEALLQRIIEASSNEGDVVLDAYCGCGTTIAVAERMKRRWIGIDITYQSISLVLRRIEKAFGKPAVDAIVQDGVPRDMQSAIALANKTDDRLRKEFEKWAVLTYTNNRAVINEKFGGDGGIDGRAYFKTGKTDNAKIVFQVKSGTLERKDIATLRGDMDSEGAALAVMITLEEPSEKRIAEAKSAGQYRHEDMGRNYDRISIVHVRDIVENNESLEIPMSLEVLAAAKRASDARQLPLPEPSIDQPDLTGVGDLRRRMKKAGLPDPGPATSKRSDRRKKRA